MYDNTKYLYYIWIGSQTIFILDISSCKSNYLKIIKDKRKANAIAWDFGPHIFHHNWWHVHVAWNSSWQSQSYFRVQKKIYLMKRIFFFLCSKGRNKSEKKKTNKKKKKPPKIETAASSWGGPFYRHASPYWGPHPSQK